MRVIDAGFLKSVAGLGQRGLPALPEICIVGRSNVGKSSLLNTLAGRKIARTGGTPGVTRLINLYTFTWEGEGTRGKAVLSDFPGFGYSKVSQGVYEGWQAMVEGYMAGNEWIRRILWVFDVRREVDPLDAMLLEWLRARGLAFSMVLTKADKVSRGASLARQRTLGRTLGQEEVFLFSSKDGYGKKEVLSHMVRALSGATS